LIVAKPDSLCGKSSIGDMPPAEGRLRMKRERLIGTTEQAAEKVAIDGVPPAKAGSGSQNINDLDASLKARST
jgi:hypothetical protein